MEREGMPGLRDLPGTHQASFSVVLSTKYLRCARGSGALRESGFFPSEVVQAGDDTAPCHQVAAEG